MASTWTFPYWMTHFDGWENSWASFDDYTVEAFRQKTGLDARRDLKLGDFADPHFRRWIDFRIADDHRVHGRDRSDRQVGQPGRS